MGFVHQVKGKSAFNFFNAEDLPWTTMAMRHSAFIIAIAVIITIAVVIVMAAIAIFVIIIVLTFVIISVVMI